MIMPDFNIDNSVAVSYNYSYFDGQLVLEFLDESDILVYTCRYADGDKWEVRSKEGELEIVKVGYEHQDNPMPWVCPDFETPSGNIRL